VPYNFERIIYILSGGDAARVRLWMAQVETQGGFRLEGDMLDALKSSFVSARVGDAAMLETMKETQLSSNYLVDPHTVMSPPHLSFRWREIGSKLYGYLMRI